MPVIRHQLARPETRAGVFKVWHAGYSSEGHLYYWLTLVDAEHGESPATCVPAVECVTWVPPDLRIGWCPYHWVRGSDGRRIPVRWKSELPSPAWRLHGWHPHAPARPRWGLAGAPADADEVMSDSELYAVHSKLRIWQGGL